MLKASTSNADTGNTSSCRYPGGPRGAGDARLRDYLDVEEVSVVRHELIDGEIVAMVGGTPEHAALSSAIPALLGRQLSGQPGLGSRKSNALSDGAPSSQS